MSFLKNLFHNASSSSMAEQDPLPPPGNFPPSPGSGGHRSSAIIGRQKSIPANIRKVSHVIPDTELEIGPMLAKGAEGVVHKARWNHKGGSIEVVVKLSYRATHFNDIDENTLTELQIMSQLMHPNVVHMHGICSVEAPLEAVGMVLDYIPEGSLNNIYYKENGIHPRKELLSTIKNKLKIAQDITVGLAYLHSKKIVHRDLKSDNILIKFEHDIPICLLTDFGVSKAVSNGVSLKTLLGTPNYMAPEVLAAEPYTNKADIFSLAMIYWEVFTMERPWDMKNSTIITNAIVFQKQRPSVELLEAMNTPAPVVEIIQQSWDEDPLKRKSADRLKEIFAALYLVH